MTKLTKSLSLAASAVLFAAMLTPAHAQSTASVHFTAPVGAGVGAPVDTTEIQCTLKVQGCSPIVSSIDVDPSQSGDLLAEEKAVGICNAVGSGCPGCTYNGAPEGGTFDGLVTVNCNCDGNAGNDYSITRLGTAAVDIQIAPVGSGRVQALNCRTKLGNDMAEDLLPAVAIRVKPNGVNGPVVFNVTHTQGGTNPRTFTVDTTGLSDQALHDAIRNGYNAMGLGLAASNRPQTDNKFSAAPATLDGNFVLIGYSAAILPTLSLFEVETVDGQTLVEETTSFESIPSLSQWGMLLLAAVVAASGAWMLRRRWQRRTA